MSLGTDFTLVTKITDTPNSIQYVLSSSDVSEIAKVITKPPRCYPKRPTAKGLLSSSTTLRMTHHVPLFSDGTRRGGYLGPDLETDVFGRPKIVPDTPTRAPLFLDVVKLMARTPEKDAT